MTTPPVLETNLEGLKPPRRGKVRDIYDLGEKLLIVATDRISAFDVVLPNAVPEKGRVLTEISKFWFAQTSGIVKNHIISTEVGDFPPVCKPHAAILEGRSMLVKKTQPLPVECVVRGYLSGSGLKEYASTGSVSGVKLPEGLTEASRLPEKTEARSFLKPPQASIVPAMNRGPASARFAIRASVRACRGRRSWRCRKRTR